LTDDEISDAIDNGDIFEKTKGILLAYSDKKALFEDVKSRRDELFEIEKVIRELGEMFVDLNNLVLSQGEMLDRIEANVEDAVDYAEKAKQNVKGARELQKRARKVGSLQAVFPVAFVHILVIIQIRAVQGATALTDELWPYPSDGAYATFE
uniref:t-SNARE coiled-coil homology domain-containing protein n=1 Tax=Heligmosomoides polygyrus TaxID=6339 RepID=A0A183GBY6_HELPZ